MTVEQYKRTSVCVFKASVAFFRPAYCNVDIGLDGLDFFFYIPSGCVTARICQIVHIQSNPERSQYLDSLNKSTKLTEFCFQLSFIRVII